MFIENTGKKINAKLKSMTASAVKWTKRFVLACAVAGAIAVGSVYVTVQTIVPHAHNIYSVAKLIDGESRGESYTGQKGVYGSIVERERHSLFPDTIHGVVYQPYSNTDAILQYNAMGDTLHENLSTELGQTILLRTAWWYTLDQFGLFHVPSEARGAHSYCRPEACARQSAYFGPLKRIGQIGNHVFYGDQDDDEVATVTANATAVPTTSLRPVARPDDFVARLVAQVVADTQ